MDARSQINFSSLIYVQGFFANQNLAQSTLNPNNVLGIPSAVGEIDLRPDFSLKNDRIELGLKPRLSLTEKGWNKGTLDGSTDRDTDTYLQEAYARIRLDDTLFVSYGREKLQWGPSYLLSPSNVFNPDNGRNSPQAEVPGLEYARMIWIPNHTWSVSMIANTGEGRVEQNDFRPAYAFKVDYTNEQKYFSLIPFYKEGGNEGFGYFAGWTATDAILLYLEGQVDEDSHSKYLLGGTYTLKNGSTIALEFFRNNDGCTNNPIATCYALGSSPVANTYVRKNYLMLQYLDTALYNDFNLTVRYIHGLDDHSGRLIGSLEYVFGQHAKLFAIGNYFQGDSNTEFGSLLDHSFLVGAGYTF
jgi:hypothetical protein